jgi:hypothetical protein
VDTTESGGDVDDFRVRGFKEEWSESGAHTSDGGDVGVEHFSVGGTEGCEGWVDWGFHDSGVVD